MLLAVVNFERILVSVLALLAMRWSFRGVRELAQGKFWPPSFYLATICWVGFGALSFELAHLAQILGATRTAIEWWRLVNFTSLSLALTCAAIGHNRGDQLRARQFYRLYDHLGEALAIAELASVDPAAAERFADECRRLTAGAMVYDGD